MTEEFKQSNSTQESTTPVPDADSERDAWETQYMPPPPGSFYVSQRLLQKIQEVCIKVESQKEKAE